MIQKLKRLLGFGSLERVAPGPVVSDDLPKQDLRARALHTKALMDKWEVCPHGPMAPFPKVTRALAFYMNEPVMFRCYCAPKEGMQRILKEHGIEVPDGALDSSELMLPFWNTLEAQLPAGPSVHEQWAARFYGPNV